MRMEKGRKQYTFHLFFLPWLVFSSPSLLGPRAPSSKLGLLISHGNRVGGNWQGKCTSWLAVPWTNWIGEKSCKLFISVQILSAAMILLGTLMKKERTGHVSQTHAFRSVRMRNKILDRETPRKGVRHNSHRPNNANPGSPIWWLQELLPNNDLKAHLFSYGCNIDQKKSSWKLKPLNGMSYSFLSPQENTPSIAINQPHGSMSNM